MHPASNIAIKSNVWIDAEDPANTTLVRAIEQIPGDLVVQILSVEYPNMNPRDTRLLADHLTKRQIEEYRVRRFFYNKGESGAAFADAPKT